MSLDRAYRQNVIWELKNWTDTYVNKVSAVDNKLKPIHRWYPFLEGFSDDFVKIIIEEQAKKPELCLDPFAGSGTTALVAQHLGIRCISYEVNPFFYQIAKAKINDTYDYHHFLSIIQRLREEIYLFEKHRYQIKYNTVTKNDYNEKWIYHKTTYNSLLIIREAIDSCVPTNYKDLFYVILGSLLIQFSNVYRDGKALRYRKDWEKHWHQKNTIYNTFIQKCINEVAPDILSIQQTRTNIGNCDLLYNCDVRTNTNLIMDDSVDLLITSPPYLNSRDYTDSYMIELWMLGHIEDYDSLRKLRRSTLRSHVQVHWDHCDPPSSKTLESSFKQLLKHKKDFWNTSIPNMIAGYYEDLQNLLASLQPKLKKNCKLYINVANSSYYGIVFETDCIFAEIADALGYEVVEIREARKIKSSSQQFDSVGFLRESVVVLRKI